MIRNFFKSTFRNIKRYSTWSILNIGGLAIAMTSVILILLWVINELSYDRHFENSDNLYRIIEKQNHPGGGVSYMAPVPGALAQGLGKEYPEIIRSSRLAGGPLTLKKGDEFIEENVTMVDKDFLQMFNIEFLQGDRNSALNDLILLCGLLAGIYPAYYLSSLDPVNTMKGLTTNIPVNSRFRRILVIFQFVLSVLLIICTLIVQRQLKFMQSKDLGFDRNNISYFMFPTRPGEPKLKTLKKELLSSPDIESVTMAWNPLFNESKSGGFSWTGKKEDEDVLFHIIESEEDYAKVYKLEIADGRFFSDGFSTDANAIVINEQAARAIGFKNATGETIINSHGTAMKIIGVVKDFHFQSLHYKIEPLIMKLGPNNNLYVRMKPGKTQSAVDFIKKTFKSFDPGLPIGLHFLDDDYNELYRAERRISEIFGYFTFLAVIISCLGLIGLSSFMTERRTKEVGIRKINWAKSAEVFLMLAGEYIGWVIIAVIIACPLAWYAMHGWLQSFAYRLPISAWVFALAGALALLIAFLTVGFQSLRAANKNPVEALRYE